MSRPVSRYEKNEQCLKCFHGSYRFFMKTLLSSGKKTSRHQIRDKRNPLISSHCSGLQFQAALCFSEFMSRAIGTVFARSLSEYP